MNLKNITKLVFGKWLIPVLIFIPILLAFIVLGLMQSLILEKIGATLLSIGFIWLICTSIYLFYKRKWLIATGILAYTILGTIGAGIIYFLLMSLSTMMDGDKWADNLTIPDDIEIFEPKGDGYLSVRPDSVLNIKRASIDFELYNSSQPGIYEYDIWIDRIENGSIYLKAYEVTQNYRLSESYLATDSKIGVYNPTDTIIRYESKEFTIYEGDWGKYYAARFEVWFKPSNGKPERKLIEKNYKIEGWMH